MQLAVTVHGSTEIGDGWFWWAVVVVCRNGQWCWIDSTPTDESLVRTLEAAWAVVLRDVALPPQTLREVPTDAA